MIPLKPYYKTLRNSFITDMEYRVNYVILVLSSFVTVAMELAIFSRVFENNEEAGGLHRSQALAFIIIGMLVRQGSQLWNITTVFVAQIRDGSFRRYLLQPIHFPSYFYATIAGPKLLTWALSALALVILKFIPGFEAILPAGTVLPFVASVALAYFLTWQLYLLVVYLGFWIEEAGFMMVAFNLGVGVFSGTLIPLTWLPAPLATVLRHSPLAIIGELPVQTGLGNFRGMDWLARMAIGVAWSIGFVVLNNFLQKRAYRAYEAYGG